MPRAPRELTYGPIDPRADSPALGRVMSHAFAFPPEDFPPYLERTGAEHFRAVRDGSGAPLATLVVIPMGQYFGGRSVPMTGIAAVGVAPEERGRGVATVLMREALREARAAGAALSALYPATQPLYRRVGYEQAGHRFETRIPIVRLRLASDDPNGLNIRAFAPDDLESVKTCYRSVAREMDGHLDRGAYIWSRVMSPRQGPASGFVVEGEGGRGIEGYVFLRQERVTAGHGSVGRHDVHISDWCAATERAGKRVLSFCAEFASMGEELVCYGGPNIPLLMLLREQRMVVQRRDWWMVRIVDVAAAVKARGWPGAARAELHLEVTDDLIPENAGKWVVRVEGGSGAAERGGSGAVKLDVGALAAWYSGYVSLGALKRLGRASGDDAAIEGAAGLTGGGTPWMPDMF